MPEPIEVVDYDPSWKESFFRLRARLMDILGTFPVQVEHVGSTSVPDAASKPVIDIDVVVRSESDVGEAIRLLEEGGYQHVGDRGISGREAFDAPSGMTAHHLYVVVEGNSPHVRHLEFRDFLRSHPGAVQRYSSLKKSLAAQFRNDREAYTEAKTSFVEETLRQAEKEEKA